MLIPPCDARQAFVRLAPDLQDISQFISTSRLSPRERVRLSNMLAGYFTGLAREHERPGLRLLPLDAPRAGGRAD
jgi:hypothetical protein